MPDPSPYVSKSFAAQKFRYSHLKSRNNELFKNDIRNCKSYDEARKSLEENIQLTENKITNLLTESSNLSN